MGGECFGWGVGVWAWLVVERCQEGQGGRALASVAAARAHPSPVLPPPPARELFKPLQHDAPQRLGNTGRTVRNGGWGAPEGRRWQTMARPMRYIVSDCALSRHPCVHVISLVALRPDSSSLSLPLLPPSLLHSE